MSYNTLVEADAGLDYLAAWSALDDAAKQRALDAAYLWLVSSYVMPDAPTAAETLAIQAAELAAVKHHLVAPLFGTAGTAEQGALTRKKTKVDVIETELVWSVPDDISSNGKATVPEAAAWLVGIAEKRLDSLSASTAFVV